MNQPKVVFNTKIHQPKIEMQSRNKNPPKERNIYIYIERERERERESIYLFVWTKYGLNGSENSKIYSK